MDRILPSGIRLPRALVWAAVVIVGSVTVLLGAVGPSARIVSPADGATVRGVVNVGTEVSHAEGLRYLVLVVDRSRPESNGAGSCSFQLDSRDLSNGLHTVQVEAYDATGLLASSRRITLHVANPPSMDDPGVPAVPMARPAAEAGGTAKVARGDSPSTRRVVPHLALTPEPAVAAAKGSAPGVRETVPTRAARAAHLLVGGRPIGPEAWRGVVDGRVYAGFRSLGTALGWKVWWRAPDHTACGEWGSTRVEVPARLQIARVNGQPVDMGGRAWVRGGDLALPVRFVAQVAGGTLTWEAETQVARVETKVRTVARR